MNIFKKFSLFTKYYNGWNSIGGRVSDSKYSYFYEMFSDDNQRKEFLTLFFDECPPMLFLGESHSNKYYILKKKWDVVRLCIEFCSLAKCAPRLAVKYFWCTIIDIKNINSDYRYYMNPTPIRKR